MNLHQLRLFYEVAKAQSVTKGAENLRISQPAVTSQLKAFQKAGGIQLLKPVGRGIQLTPLGEKIYEKARELFAIENEIEKMISHERNNKTGKLQIAGNYLTVQKVLPFYIQGLTGKQLQLVTLNTSDSLQLLLDNEVELAVLGPLGQENSTLDSVELYRDELCFVIQPNSQLKGKKISLRKLGQLPFIGREKTSYTQKALIKLFNEEGVAVPEFIFRFNNSREALEQVLAREAIYFCSRLLVAEELANGELAELRVDVPVIKHSLYLYWRKDDELSPIAQAFRKAVIEGGRQSGNSC